MINEIKLNLFGIEPEDVQILLNGVCESCNIRLVSSKHIGGWGELYVIQSSSSDLKKFTKECFLLFPNKVIIGENILEHIIHRLIKLNRTISFAESCTGGMLSSFFTAISGSSAVFNGSMVTYSNEIKASWLGVNKTTLEVFGAVSSQTVEEMAVGILKKADANYAISVSGIAGPTGGSLEKPVGTVYIAVVNKKGDVFSERLSLQGDRNQIQIASAYNAIRLLLVVNPELI